MDFLTGPKAANRLSKVLNQFHAIHGGIRFPVDVTQLALGCHEIFNWKDPIVQVEAASITGFEGCLLSDDERSRWLLLYNDRLSSLGRIRFTQAHELGHYILHRLSQSSFECVDAADMHNLSTGQVLIEQEADEFASYLLMPLDDFRKQLTAEISFDALGHCADRYGVSLTAACLKWISQTTDKAMLVLSNDGFINWAWSSDSAAKAGIFYRTRANVIPLPEGSLAADSSVAQERIGRQVRATAWFKHADPGISVREMKISSDQFGNVLTLLIFPSITNVWPDRQSV
jgi:hypothetical protein